MKFILGKKIETTQRFKEDGAVVPVTVVAAGPCLVTQVKTEEKDSYQAVQLGFGEKKKLKKPQKGHLKGLGNFRYLREFLLDKKTDLKRGDQITVSVFQPGDVATVRGISKGKGFQGVVKRHGFAGSPASHGHKDQLRMPGSIGATDPGRVFKGTRMAGQMGNQRVTVKNLEIIEVNREDNLLFVKGAVPGARNSLVLISAEGEMKLESPKVKKEAGIKKEDNKSSDKESKGKASRKDKK